MSDGHSLLGEATTYNFDDSMSATVTLSCSAVATISRNDGIILTPRHAPDSGLASSAADDRRD